MRLIAILLTALFAACTAPVASRPAASEAVVGSPSDSVGTPTPDTTPSPSLPSPWLEPSWPEPSFDLALVDAALAYAAAAGFELAPDGLPTTSDEAPVFDSVVLHRVSLPLVFPEQAALAVFFDDAGSIRVVGDGFYNRPIERVASRSEVLLAADRHLRQGGVDPATGSLHVASGEVGNHWYLTFDREIAGYPVGNAPMAWWLSGDKAYLELRPDASLANFYGIRPGYLAVPMILDRDELAQRLAEVAELSPQELERLGPELVWVRAQDPQAGSVSDDLSLSYCATERWDYGWQAWCVDAGTGAFSAQGRGVD